MVVELLSVAQEEVDEQEDHEEGRYQQVAERQAPAHHRHKCRLQSEVLPKHAVQQAPVQVPLQSLSQHELLAQPKAGALHFTESRRNPEKTTVNPKASTFNVRAARITLNPFSS
ncbi:MAG: hypothetical protein FRX49_01375 [Trebouxia sp. A1-2]|nr:MAG: hypothetical protein FRX49_01375 [Trebouxia sp. A1-2]